MKFLFDECNLYNYMASNHIVYNRREAVSWAFKIFDTNKTGQDFDVGKYNNEICYNSNILYKTIIENVKYAEEINDFDTKHNDIGALYAANNLMDLYNKIDNGDCQNFISYKDGYVFVEGEELNIGYKYFIRREDIKNFIFDLEKKGSIILTNYEGQIVDADDNDCFNDPLFTLVKEWCVLNKEESIKTMSIDEYDVICFGNSIDELLDNIHNANFYYANGILKNNKFLDNRKYFIVINELNEHIAENKNLELINLDFNYDKNCKLTIGQLEKLLNDISDIKIDRSKTLDLINKYKGE